jgi:serine/threonine protein kinase
MFKKQAKIKISFSLYHLPHLESTVPMPTRTFGPYKLIKTIGEGEFGKVKLAVSDTGQEVAIKLVRKSSLDNEMKHSKLMREMSLLQVTFTLSDFCLESRSSAHCETDQSH